MATSNTVSSLNTNLAVICAMTSGNVKSAGVALTIYKNTAAYTWTRREDGPPCVSAYKPAECSTRTVQVLSKPGRFLQAIELVERKGKGSRK